MTDMPPNSSETSNQKKQKAEELEEEPTKSTSHPSSGNEPLSHNVNPVASLAFRPHRSDVVASSSRSPNTQPQGYISSEGDRAAIMEAARSIIAGNLDNFDYCLAGPPPGKKVNDALVKATQHVECCLILNPAPCLYCAFDLQDGRSGFICRRDSLSDSSTCVECAYAGRRCTWGGYTPSEAICRDLFAARAEVFKLPLVGKITKRHLETQLNFQAHATVYLAALWENANIDEIFGVHCRYKPPEHFIEEKKQPTARRKGKEKLIKKNPDEFPKGFSVYLGQLGILRELIRQNVSMVEAMSAQKQALDEFKGDQVPPEIFSKYDDIKEMLEKQNGILMTMLKRGLPPTVAVPEHILGLIFSERK